jgi:hypothetical protein
VFSLDTDTLFGARTSTARYRRGSFGLQTCREYPGSYVYTFACSSSKLGTVSAE